MGMEMLIISEMLEAYVAIAFYLVDRRTIIKKLQTAFSNIGRGMRLRVNSWFID